MKTRIKLILCSMIGLSITTIGWFIENDTILVVGIIIWLAFIVSAFMRNDEPSHDKPKSPNVDPKPEKPISAVERVRGRRELIKWLEGFIADGYGDKLMHLDFKEKRKPSEVLQGLIDQTEQGKKDLESYILTNRKDWREHYSDEELAAAKTKAVEELTTIVNQDDYFVSFDQQDYSARQLIQAVNNEDKVGMNHIIKMANWLKTQKD